MAHRVFLIDDHPVMRDGIKMLLNRSPELEVCGEAVDANEVLQALPRGWIQTSSCSTSRFPA